MVRVKGTPMHRSQLGISEENEDSYVEDAEYSSNQDEGRRGRSQRQSYTIQFKKDTLDLLDSLSDCKNKWKKVADARNVNKSLIIKWNKARVSILENYECNNQHRSKPDSVKSWRQKKRTFVNKTRCSKFPLAEQSLIEEYTLQKKKGRKISNVWLKKIMKEKIASLYGKDEAGTFKASNNWFKRFKNRNNISLKTQISNEESLENIGKDI